MGWTLRWVAIALALGRLALADLVPPPAWASGVLPALAGALLAAFAIAFEPRVLVRRLFELALVVGYAAWIVHDELGWHVDAFHLELAAWTVGEGVLVVCFIETRLWRWSLFAALPLLVMLAYYLFPRYTAGAIDERIAWLVQALAVLAVNGGRRAIREDDGHS